ncbi:ABC transporter ATP-binding protein [Pseudooceanicola sp. C21-150M6]|uniref:ABC transporter ATP-binding protein n=1 Tax=Pseudooceanicola sp. C21-150M6 TaxID=3434355 RepID=UPI003D7F5EFD
MSATLTELRPDTTALHDLREVTMRFGGVVAVNSLSMGIPRGAVHGLIGPNGAGKTTVINMITGMFTPTEGEIHFDGTRTDGLPTHDIAALGIARTYQNVRLFSGMSALEQVMTGCYLGRDTGLLQSFLGLPSSKAAWKRSRQRALALLDRVGLADRADELAETMSYGEQRRVEIARALGSDPKLILLDEPAAGMNQSEASEIGRLVVELRDTGLTVLMVEHNMSLVTEFCESCTVINFGQKLAEGDPRTCLADPEVQAAYFGRKKTHA